MKNNLMNNILKGNLKDKMKSGYMIIGPNLSDGSLSTWHCSREEEAVRLSSHWAATDGGAYEIIKYELMGVVRPANYPVEYATPSGKKSISKTTPKK